MSDITVTGNLDEKSIQKEMKRLEEEVFEEQYDYPLKNSEFKDSGIVRWLRATDPRLDIMNSNINIPVNGVNGVNGIFVYDLPNDRNKEEIKQGTFPENNGIFKFEYPDEKIKK